MTAATYWWTAYGWADKGSKLQTQLYVNRQPEELTTRVLEALPTLRDREPVLEWVVPLEKPSSLEARPFAEPRDATMLAKLKLSSLKAELAEFWPARGAVWDALAICHFPDKSTGVLLAEGKNYPREMYSAGTAAGKSGTPAAIASRHQIERAVAWVQGRLQMPLDVSRWLDPLDRTEPNSSLYQTANRIAYAVWLQSQGIDTWLCHLLYLNDPLHHPTSCSAWKEGLAKPNASSGSTGSSSRSRATPGWTPSIPTPSSLTSAPGAYRPKKRAACRCLYGRSYRCDRRVMRVELRSSWILPPAEFGRPRVT